MGTLLRLTLLLVGRESLRRSWPAFVGIALILVALGAVFVLDLHGLSVAVTTDLFALLLALLALRKLFALARPMLHGAWLRFIEAFAFLCLSVFAFYSPWDDDLVAAFVVGIFLLLDGTHRVLSLALIRPLAWRRPLIVALAEIVVVGLIWLPSPVPPHHAAAFVIGLLLVIAGLSLGALGLALRSPAARSSATTEPARRDANPLTLHVWTPAGHEVGFSNRMILDRYIAAIGADGLLKTGHVALSVAPDIYVSLCPVTEFDQSSRAFRHMLVGRPVNDVAGYFQNSLAEESRERGNPDTEVLFLRYDPAALRRFLFEYRQAEHYNLTSRNCASTVALCLDAALAGALADKDALRTAFLLIVSPRMWRVAFWRARAEAMTWTPGLLLDYARALQQVIEPERLRSPRSGSHPPGHPEKSPRTTPTSS